MKNLLCIFVLFMIVISCNKSKNKLYVTILNDKLEAVNFNKEYHNKNIKSILKIRIENLSDSNYVLSNVCLKSNCDFFMGEVNSFPNNYHQLNLKNLSIINNKDTVKVKSFIGDKPNFILKNESINDSLTKINYKTLEYTDDSFSYINNILSDNLIYIKSKEVLFFETYVYLPFNNKFQQYLELSKDNDYKVFLKINSDTTNIKKYLTWSQLKNIEENNYKLYHGTLVSENSVPIEFID